MLVLLDASVIVRGTIGRSDQPSALILATIRLGGLEACTIENAMQEARHRLLQWENRNKVKISRAQTDRALEGLRRAPRFTVHAWIVTDREILPSNVKDAYLLQAVDAYRPTCLLTTDGGLLALGSYGATEILTPWMLLEQLDALDT